MKNRNDKTNIRWYGRCCFLVELNKQRILVDPYDRFCNVDMGLVDAEVLISSSTWHDHGHIGAAPGAWVFTYAGIYEHQGIKISGMEVKEERGSPTVVFNFQYENVSITNFADMGTYEKNIFTDEQKKILRSTNIAFIRSGHEKVLEFCNPKVIFPEHYFPRQFIADQVPDEKKSEFESQNIEIDKMFQSLKYSIEEINDYQYSINTNDMSQVKIINLLKVHPNVRYTFESEINKYW